MNPTINLVHVNNPLTDISVAYIQSADNFVATKLFPMVTVQKKSDLYFKYAKGDFLRDLAKLRAPATESAGAGYGLDTDSYICKIRALHKDISDEERENEDSPLSGDRDATDFLTQSMLISRETSFFQTFFKTGIWGADATPAVKFNAAGSDPIGFFDAKRREITGKTGMNAANIKLCVSPAVDAVLKNHEAVLDRTKYTSSESITNVMLARLFGIGEYMVAEAVVNSAKEGATDSVDYLFSQDSALLVYSAPRPSLKMPSGGYTFSWGAFGGAGQGGVRISKFRMDNLRADRIEAEMAYDQKLVAADCGIFINDILG